MGLTTIAEEEKLAEIYCPTLLRRYRKLEHLLGVSKHRYRGRPIKVLPLTDENREWVLRMRREITSELLAEWADEVRVYLYSLQEEQWLKRKE